MSQIRNIHNIAISATLNTLPHRNTTLEEVVGSIYLCWTGRVCPGKSDGRNARPVWGGNGKWRWRKTRMSWPVTMRTVRSCCRATWRAGIVGCVSKTHRLAARRCTERCRRRKCSKSTWRCHISKWATIQSSWTAAGKIWLPVHNITTQTSEQSWWQQVTSRCEVAIDPINALTKF